MSFGQQPLTIVEIDQDLCENVYGTSPCTAAIGVTGVRKCFNTRNTCQDPDNYALGDPLTLRFAIAHSDLPDDVYLIPSIQSIRTSPTRINVGGRTGIDKPFGRRAEVTITLKDHPHSDNIVDPYLDERDYNPLDRSTFWAKWLHRNPFWNNRPIRLLEGYVGQSLAEMQKRHYLIESISGPDSRGNVTIKARDSLTLVDNDKAQAPSLTRGILLSGITSSSTSMTVTGAPIEDYTAYSTNAVRLSDEIIRYTSLVEDSNGDLIFSGLIRGSDTTVATTHAANDSVQACLEYIDERPDAVAYDLIVNRAGVNPSFINYPSWQAEATLWLGSIAVTRLITEPIGVNELLGDLSEQALIYIWWDERLQTIKFRAVRPELDAVPLVTEDNNLIQNETSLQIRPELRASEIWVSFLPITPVGSRKSREQYRRTRARIDPEAASPTQYGERRVYEVFSDWLTTEAQVDLLTFRLLARYRRNSAYIKFQVDAKDRDILDVGGVFDIMYKGFTDSTGAMIPIRYQVISAHESPPGERVIIEAQRFDFDVDGRFGRWMVSDAPVYSLASDTEKAAGMWWADNEGKVAGDDGYTWS